MVECAICGKTFQHAGGLSGHVRFGHKIDWNAYKAGNYTESTSAPAQAPAPNPPVVNPAPAPKPRSRFETRPMSQVQGLSEANLQNIADRIFNRLQGNNPVQGQLPRGVTAMQGLEEVEVIGEKINYKVALNPDVFWRWNVFKGQNIRLAGMGQAELFQGDFSDFIDLSTKTLLSTYGMYPTVMTFTGGKMLVEMPITRDEE